MASKIKIVSFDVEGTMVTTDFSAAIWFEAIPREYAQKHGMEFEEAKKKVFEEYAAVGDQRSEWYDIHYWVHKFDIGTADTIMSTCSPSVSLFPEVMDVLSSLHGKYELTVASGTPHEFLQYLLHDIKRYFNKVFSSTSDDKQLKDARFFTNMCRKLKVHPGEVVHIGDNWQFDYLAAGESGIKAYYLDRNSEHPERNSLKTLSELVDILNQ